MFHKPPFHDCRQRSSALIIVLAAIVLISAIVLVFFQQSSLNRQISFSSASQYRADLTAATAMNTILGDLRNEIAAGSQTTVNGLPSVVNNVAIYVPSANATAVPCQVLPSGDVSSLNLIKQSMGGSAFWTGGSYGTAVVSPVRSVAGNTTTAASLNGRSIGINRWNLPGLLGDPGSSTASGYPAGSPTYKTAPDWVIVTRGGVISQAASVPSVATLANRATSNLSYAVGRYAYTIYDEGGLLDANVAGYPSAIAATDDFATKRGLLPQVNLGNIPGVADAADFVKWRNAATAASATSYTNYVFTATNGFTTVAAGDQSLLSRRDLINYAQANPGQIATSALQYLGTFTRAVNAPSYTPPSARFMTQSGDGFRSASNPGSITSLTDNQFNPSLVNTRVTVSFQRDSDGTTAAVGEPLIKYRFPLSRLALFGNSNSAIDNGSGTIYKYFGLTRTSASSPWVYNHGSSGGRGNGQSILLLTDVANLGREPDFFELLQAGILVGSLGKGAGQGAGSINDFSEVKAIDNNTCAQVIQIGANLMDQYDTDSFPTRIQFGTPTPTNDGLIAGVENLPYMAYVWENPYRSHINNNQLGIWYVPIIWNPHAEATTPPATPSQFRYVVTGSVSSHFFEQALGSSTGYFSPITNFPDPASTPDDGIKFSTSSSQTFAEPVTLDQSNSFATGNNWVTEAGIPGPPQSALPPQLPPPGVNFVGICTGLMNLPENQADDSIPSPNPFVTHQLQYWDGAQWVTYSEMRNFQNGSSVADGDNFYRYILRCLDLRSDPRTDRFGAFGTDHGFTTTMRPAMAQGQEAHAGTSSPGAGWIYWFVYPSQPYAASTYFGYLCQNLLSSPTHYSDPDLVQRRADGAYTVKSIPTAGVDGLPLATGNTPSRPVILNRPFRSVAEMGYASRGMPWKHLDFFTLQSADAALLDLFCLNDETPTPPVADAGQVDLNTRQTTVLSAVLQGALKAEDDPVDLSSSEANSLAGILTTMTASSPLLNRSELVTRWISSDTYNIPANPAPNVTTVLASSDEIIKRRREAAVRALADVGNTRTWNLLIDVIAQSGQYTPASTNLNQFLVTGEKRYWLHVAIDRYTGKVVAQSLEPVYE